MKMGDTEQGIESSQATKWSGIKYGLTYSYRLCCIVGGISAKYRKCGAISHNYAVFIENTLIITNFSKHNYTVFSENF
jgi:hypothetical protein